jgi:uncharacterized protein
MASVEAVQVCVAYALPEEQRLVSLSLTPGATVRDAVERSGLLQRFPDIGRRPLQCAIFSRVVALDEVLSPGDRVEILRPLLVDPKQQRREEAARARAAAGRSAK